MKKFMIAISCLVLVAGCKSEIDGKTQAEVSEATTTGEAKTAEPKDDGEETTAKPTKVAFDTEASKIEWVGAKVSDDHDGGFEKFDGHVTYDADGNIASVQVGVDTTSVWSDTAKLTKHLKSDDFFDTAKFSTATFTSTAIEPITDGGTHRVTGDLDLRGIKKQISFPVTIKKEASQTLTTSEFTIKRFDWDINYKGKADDLINDEVLIKLHVVTPHAETS